MKERRLLLTGASGFLGGHLIRYFQFNFPDWKLFIMERNGVKSNEFPLGITKISQSELWDSLEKYGITDIIHLAGKAHDTSKTTDADSYFIANYELTKWLYDLFVKSSALSFIFLSSIKSIHDTSSSITNEKDIEDPVTPYGRSKKKAEEYILSKGLSINKRYFILRPVLVYGKGVKGNLASLKRFVSKGIPYPFASFENKRSYLSVNNLGFVISELLNAEMKSDVFNLANDEPISTNDIVLSLGKNLKMKIYLLKIPQPIWHFLAKLGDLLRLPFNSESLGKLTRNFVVSNSNITHALGKPLPEKTMDTIGTIV